MDKKKVIVLAIAVLGLIGIIIGVNSARKDKNTPSNQNTSTTKNDQKLVKAYAGSYGMSLKDSNGKDYTENLYLKEDGTFVLDINSYGVSYHPTAGTYEIKDNEITLTEIVRYANDTCYYTDELSTYKIEIKDKDTLTISLNDRVVDFVKNVGTAETEEIKKYYVAYPKDGELVPGFKTHNDCTAK